MNERYVYNNIIGESDDKRHLLGGRCCKCGSVVFPARPTCCDCAGEEIEMVPLSDHGTLFSYTTSEMPVPNLGANTSLGWVDLPEGIRLFAPLKQDPNHPFQIGAPVTVEIGPMWTEKGKDGEETAVIAYRYAVTDQEV